MLVDTSTCDLKARAVLYTLDAGVFTSYETCDDGFRGNCWVGFCRTCEAVEELDVPDARDGGLALVLHVHAR